MLRVLSSKAMTLLLLCLSLVAASAQAGELADLHRRLAGPNSPADTSGESLAQPTEPGAGGADGVPGVRPLIPL
ncbi:MAG TPA: hypothetical protein VFD39_00635, partial [Trueperaceae bacterium]|nr:hypothetical protein [Trueperaceae bacterium]